MDEPSSSPLDIVSVRFRRAAGVPALRRQVCASQNEPMGGVWRVANAVHGADHHGTGLVRGLLHAGHLPAQSVSGLLQPKFDPSLKSDLEMEDAEEGQLPTEEPEASSSSEEFKPFIRRLPEFKFWHSATRATVISLVCSFIPAFDIPVFWPILLIYFFILFSLTMKKQIQHMIKYRYLPFDIGKKTYK